MKKAGRIIGALFMVGMFCLSYFGSGGKYFKLFILACLCMCLCEMLINMDRCNYEDAFRDDYKYRASVPLVISLFIVTIWFSWQIPKDFLAMTVVGSCLSDTFAFVFGKSFGGGKSLRCVKDISGSKTLIGFISGAILPFPFIIIFAMLTGVLDENYHLVIAYAAIAGIVAIFGDLLESAAKRTMNIKDSGTALREMPILGLFELPLIGHGGYCDRFDSIAVSIAVMFLILNIASLF